MRSLMGFSRYVIRQELENLQQFKNVAGILQPAGVATFPNSYTTNPSNNPQIVIYGILLEYYNCGTLQQIFNKNNKSSNTTG